MTINIVPFHPDLIPEAGALLAQRHQRDRVSMPELPDRYEDPAVAQAAVEAVWRRENAGGVAALDNGRLVGYLIGDMVFDPLWGRSAWVRLPGCAATPEQNAELVRRLYAKLGAQWVKFGCFAHFALVPIADPALILAWFTLSFGVEQVHALRALDELDLFAPADLPDITIRRARPEDRQALAGLSDIIWRQLARAPVWGIHLPESESEDRAAWAALVDEPDVAVWLAFSEGEAVGSIGYYPSEAAAEGMLIPDRCIRLTIATLREPFRGRGIGRALARQALDHARDEGFHYCETDWRSANLAASRFASVAGFRPLFYRLTRRIDDRIAWANEQALE